MSLTILTVTAALALMLILLLLLVDGKDSKRSSNHKLCIFIWKTVNPRIERDKEWSGSSSNNIELMPSDYIDGHAAARQAKTKNKTGTVYWH